MHERPFTDITTFVAIDSLFEGKVPDPWADACIGNVVNNAIYKNTLGYIAPVQSNDIDPHSVPIPKIVEVMRSHSDFSISASARDVSRHPKLTDQEFATVFPPFVTFLKTRKSKIKKFTTMHFDPRLIEELKQRISSRFLFDLGRLSKSNVNEFETLRERTGFTFEEIAFLFDIVLRTPLYGESAIKEGLYLRHPIRDGYLFQQSGDHAKLSTTFPLDFQYWAREWAPKLGRREFVRQLNIAKAAVQETELAKLNRGPVDEGLVEEIAMAMRLPPTVDRRYLRIAKPAATGFGIRVALQIGYKHPYGALAAIAVPILLYGWNGKAPFWTTRLKFLRKHLAWPELQKGNQPPDSKDSV